MKVFEKTPTLKLHVVGTSVCLLNPGHSGLDGDDILEINPDGAPRYDTVVDGYVTLDLPDVKRIKRLQVELLGRQNILIKGQYDTYELLHETLELDKETELLSPGEHRYAFSFVVPSNSAPYDRGPYGRTYHKCVATATGLGKFGKDLIAEKPFYLIANHSTNGGVPPGFEMQREIENPHLGPVGLALTSKYLIVSGYLRLNVSMPIISQPVQLDDICVNLLQKYELQNLRKPHMKSAVNQITPLWTLKAQEDVGTLRPGRDFHLSRQFRLPNDDAIRPSTAERSITGIRVSHQLQVILRFTPLVNNPLKQQREIKYTGDAIMSSCCCMLSSVQLPAYDSCDGGMAKNILDEVAFCNDCLCRIADSDMALEAGYAIPPEDLKRARLRAAAVASWKSDSDFQTEICDRQGFEAVDRVSSISTDSDTPPVGPVPYYFLNSYMNGQA